MPANDAAGGSQPPASFELHARPEDATMSRPRILVVEDDSAIRRGVVDALTFAGYGVSEAADAPSGQRAATHSAHDLLLLDLVLPGGDGLQILQEIRRVHPNQPVIILTARGEEEDRCRGLRLGADDYVVKPFSVKELLARIEAVLRRSPERPRSLARLAVPGAIVDLARSEASFDDGTRVELSEKEVELLQYLASHAGRVISREELLQRVWQIDPRGVSTRAIDMHVTRLREKLRDDPTSPRVILTVRGKGYMLASPVASPAR